jgi:membrane protein DedA with SNARE-associated domain
VRLALVAYGEAALLVGIALAGIMQTGTPYDVFSLVTGALVGPVLAFWLGHHLRSGRVERAPGTAAAPI